MRRVERMINLRLEVIMRPKHVRVVQLETQCPAFTTSSRFGQTEICYHRIVFDAIKLDVAAELDELS